MAWEATLGTTRDQAPFPMWLDLGSPNLGGAVATASGLVFIGATPTALRGFDAETGVEDAIVTAANAGIVTYRLREDGRQYLVVPAGGCNWWSGDAVIAFALP